MDSNIQKFVGIATKVRTPLALAGLTLVILYAIYKIVLSLNVFEKIGSNSTFLILQDVIDKLFWLALLALILGVISYLATTILSHKAHPLSSNVRLISADLDPHDSPYKQYVDGGRRKIRYKGRQQEEKDVQH